MSTITNFLDTLAFAAVDLEYVNKQVILGSLWWVSELPEGTVVPEPLDPPEEPETVYAVWDANTETIISWTLTDLSDMIRQVARGATNGAPSTLAIGKMIDDEAETTTLKAFYVDPALGNVMLQFWAFGKVNY